MIVGVDSYCSARLEVIKIVGWKGNDIAAKGEDMQTVLHRATWSDPLEVVKWLIETRGNMTAKSREAVVLQENGLSRSFR